MTSARRLLGELDRLGVRVDLVGDRLRCRAPATVLDGTVTERITAHRDALVNHLGLPRPIDVAAPGADAPLSFGQQSLWFLQQLEPESSAYNEPLVIRLRGRLRIAALEQALAEVERRHDVLRTTFASRSGEPRQQVHRRSCRRLRVMDLRPVEEARRAPVVEALAAAEVRRPFRLDREAPWRTTLVVVADEHHQLWLTRHHVAGDGWSVGILLRELSVAYAAFVAGRPVVLPSVPLQCASFAAWQHELDQRGAYDDDVAELVDELAGTPALRVGPSSAGAAEAAGRAARSLTPAASAAVAQVAAGAGATPFAVPLSAFALVASRHWHEDDLVIGVPTAGRAHVELEGLVATCTNVVPIRVSVLAHRPFVEQVRAVADAAAEALARADVPFERVVAALPGRVPGHSPLALGFAFQNIPLPTVALPALHAELVLAPPVAPKFPLLLAVTDVGGTYECVLEWDRGAVADGLAHAVLAEVVAVLEAVAAAPATPGRRLVASACAPPRPASWAPVVAGGPATLDRRFAAVASDRPDAVAVVDGERAISYRELHRRSAVGADLLRQRGIGPEDVVAVQLAPTIELVVTLLAVVQAGAAYLPIDRAVPDERVAAVVGAAGAVLLVTDGARDVGVPVVTVDALLSPGGRGGATPWPESVDERLAYVISTSGSTGEPKGVAVTHRNVVTLLDATRPLLDLGPDDVWSLTHSIGFDVSAYELWGALLHGARVVLAPRPVVREPGALANLLRQEQVTVLSQTPTALEQLLPILVDDLPPALRHVLLAGEPFHPHRLRHWFDRHGHGGPVVTNLYGITEVTVHTTARRLAPSDVDAPASSPIGGFFAGRDHRCTDRYGCDVPVGGVGELHVRGVGNARGYLRRPAATADRFRPDPAPAAPGERVYRSGDLVRRLADDLDFVGRNDEQLKVRGFRIEPAEVRAHLLAHEEVGDVVVRGLFDRRPPELAAWVVPAGEGSVDLAALRRWLTGRVPDHLVPARWAAIERVPMSPTGKVDWRELPAPAPARRAVRTPARTPTEHALVALWSELLGVEEIGTDESFFELGGHSILFTRLLGQVPEAFGVELELRDAFEAADIASLAVLIDDRGGGLAELGDLIAEIAALTEEEVARRLG